MASSIHLAAVLESPLGRNAVAVFAAIGVSWVLSQVLGFLYGFWVMFLRPGKDFKRTYGSWALVTGCTDGIGKAIAAELAKKKINIILVSRTLEKLEDAGRELSGKYGVQTKSVALDLSLPPGNVDAEKGFAEISKLVGELDVGILVNNAGISYSFAKYVHELEEDRFQTMISLNVIAVTRLVRIVVPKMLERKRGAIVNIGSGAATVIPSDPLYAVYAASKAYVDQLSKTLTVELGPRGIDVQCQAPLYVSTKLSKIRHASISCPSPATYAKCAVKWIGYEPRCTPYWAHGVMWAVISRLPEGVMDSFLLSRNTDIRRRGLAKEAKAKKGE